MNTKPTYGTILIVDDMLGNLRILSQMLAEHGYEVRTAKTGSEAIASVNDELPGLILLDIKLPDINGYEVCATLKANNKTKAVPVVFLSALNETAEKLSGYAAGGVDYITKPFISEEVFIRVQTHLELGRLRSQLEHHASELQLKNEQLQIEVSERKLTEKTLQALSSRQEAILAAVPDIIMQVDSDKVYTWANKAGLEFFGDDVIGRDAQYYFEGEQDTYNMVNPLFIGDESVIYIESWQRRKDGQKKLLAWWCRVLKDEHGKVTGALSTARDITERKLAVEALKNSEEQFRTIFDNVSDGMFLIDPETRKFIMYNAACSQMLGYCWDEFLNMDSAAIHPSEEIPIIFEQIEKILHGAEGIRSDIKFKSKDGSIFTADHSLKLVTIAEKKLLLIVFRDITERLLLETELRTAKEKAEESDKLKTAFLHSISHEIRTPLNGIIGFSDMITNPDLSPEKREQFSYIIRNCSDQLLGIVNDIISIATIEAGHEKPYEKESDINRLLQLIKNQNNLITKTKNISFTVSSDLTNDEAIVFVDETKLLHILTNLLSNATKFTFEGYIKVNCRIDGDFIIFTVEDSGIGIQPEMHEKIFDRFFQIDHSDARSYGGTGLGLSIVKSYVHFLKGDIRLNSKPGQGSEFIISIPYKPVKQPKPVTITVHDDLKQINHATILIAEDEIANFELLSAYLSDLNLTVVHAADGLQAVEICKNNPSISLVLMDVKMPRMDGYEASRQIKEFRPQLPVIIQTAYVFQNEREKSLSAYIDGFIEKPISQDKLLETLQKYLMQ